MGTKNNPGSYDCYANAEPDEPMFVLLARDKFAPHLVEMWADQREGMIGMGVVEDTPRQRAKIQEARDCAESMRAWWREHRGV